MSPLGIITEDKTDFDAITVLVRRILKNAKRPAPRCLGFFPTSGGCGQMRRKTPKWIREMARDGCEAFVLVHDLDRSGATGELNDEDELRRTLGRLVDERGPRGPLPHVCIPVEELEAWFWCDQALVDRLGRGSGKAHPSPHKIRRPKEALRHLAMKGRGKPYATTENPDLAESLDLQRCAERCPAFAGLQTFILNTCR